MIQISLDKKNNKGIIFGDHFKDVYEHFSVSNPAASFMKGRYRFIPNRIHAITPSGRFNIGMFDEILNFCKGLTDDIQIDNQIYTQFTSINVPIITQLGQFTLRDYQQKSVEGALKKGRGVIVLATAAGKTLTLAALLTSIHLKQKIKALIVVPNRSLVTQTFSDFADYNVPFTYSKWTGDDNLDTSSDVIIANVGIMQSKNSNLTWLKNINIFIQDEIHGLKKTNQLNDIFKNVTTPHRFGFTGTLPPNKIDVWNIVGHIGPVVYEKTSAELRDEKYIANVEVISILINYKNLKIEKTVADSLPAADYLNEMNFLKNNSFRNSKIVEIVDKLNKNTLILLDHIEHGEKIYQLLQQTYINKDVYFIRGDVDVEEREKTRQLAEQSNNVIIVAISKIFSTGISIKNLHYLIFASGGKAKVKTLQSIGRGLRLHPQKEKLVIFDIADLIEYGNQHYTERKKLYDVEKIKNTEIQITEK